MKPQTRSAARAVSAAAGIALLAACVPHTAQYSGAMKTARNEIHLVRMIHPVGFAADGLAEAEAVALAGFLQRHKVGYGDAVSIVAADGFGTPATRDVAQIVRGYGLQLVAPPATLAEMPQPGAAVLVVDRYVVTPPDCPNTSLDATRNYGNARSPQFGCADVINLGQMVASPRDLVTGTGEGLPVTDKASQSVRTWREEKSAVLAPPKPQQARK